jgi:hypothetical protein
LDIRNVVQAGGKNEELEEVQEIRHEELTGWYIKKQLLLM